MSRRILLTGGAGFIGHHIVEHILETTDWDVIILDGLTYAGRVDRLTDIKGFDPARVKVHWHDLRSPIPTSLDRKIGDVTSVINAASNSHVDASLEDPVNFVKNNNAIVVNMLEWARGRTLDHFVQVSTDEVYGPAPLGRPSKEWDPQLPSNPYSASKSGQEASAIAWWRSFGVPVIITNTMNNFGERQEPEKFVPKAISHILRGEKMPIHATHVREHDIWVASSRVFMHARNHADALCFLIENHTPASYSDGELWPSRFNVAGEREVGCDEVVSILAHALDIEAWGIEYVEFHKSRPGHDLRYSLDGGKLAGLGWKAPVPFEESLARTARWTRDRRGEWL